MSAAIRIRARSPAPSARRIRAFAFQARTPPVDAQLWNVGENPTDYGIHLWTERSAREVMARYEERGNPLLIDVEHNGSTIDGEPAPTGGYARLELRGGAPWLVFDWSTYGVEQIASGQRRFLSGEYDCDPNTNEIIRLIRVSLVAEPGTHRARVLASAAQRTAKGTPMDPTIAAILALLTSVSDPAAAVEAVKGFIAALDPGTSDVVPGEGEPVIAGAPPVPTEEDPKKVAAKAAPRAGLIVDPVPGQPAQTPEIPGSPPGTKPGPAPAPGAPDVPVTPPAPAPAPVPPPRGEEGVRVAASAAVRQVEIAHRDYLLQTEGDRLAPSIRTWASSQSLQVVRGLIDAAPARDTGVTRVAATRGATQGAAHGSGPGGLGLQGAELEELEKGMGTFKASAPETPHRNKSGQFVFPRMTPTEQRRFQAAAADQKGGK